MKNYSVILGVLGFLLLTFFIWYFSSIVAYVLISVVLSMLGHPLVRILDKLKIGKYHIPHSLNAFLTLIVILGIFTGLLYFFVPLISQQAKIISKINIHEVVEYFGPQIKQLQQFLINFGAIGEGENVSSVVETSIKKTFSLTTFSNIFSKLLSATGAVFIGLFSILFITFFFLKDENMFTNILILLAPEKYSDEIEHVMKKVKYLISRYFIGLLGELVTMMTLITIGLTIFGIKNALIIGFLGGLMNIIPYLGPIIGTSIGVVIGMTTSLSLGLYEEIWIIAFETIGVFVTANLIDNILLQPLIYSSSVKAHPIEIFIVIIAAGTIAGIPGMIIAIPAYTVLRVIAKEFLSKFRLVRSLTKDI